MKAVALLLLLSFYAEKEIRHSAVAFYLGSHPHPDEYWRVHPSDYLEEIDSTLKWLVHERFLVRDVNIYKIAPRGIIYVEQSLVGISLPRYIPESWEATEVP